MREAIPEISITTDIIVGFPGEEKKDFEDTLNMVRKTRFDGAFTFAYSPLPGTKAFEFSDQVPREIKIKRLGNLIDIQKKITQDKNQFLVGKEFEVLVEGISVKNPQELQGRTRQNKIIVFKGEKGIYYMNGRVDNPDSTIIYRSVKDLFIFLKNFGDIYEGML